ncbi:MAG: thioredoxin family protein [Sphingobacteriales bacterium]|nr:thioredoxin family protein [Sphingobacteriales bacterium]
MQKLAFSFIFITSLLCSFAYKVPEPKSKLKWMTLAEAEKAMKLSSKPLLIDLYTDWCGWCKVMDKKTYDNEAVAAYLQEKFYLVKLDAETRDSIHWAGRAFAYNKQYRINEFAVYLTGGDLSFPHTIFINDIKADPQAIGGYMKPQELEPIAKYFGEGNFGKISYQSFQQTFKPAW